MFTLADCHTQAQAADVFTKAFTDPEAWERAVALIGMIDGPTSRRLLKQGGAGTARAAPAAQQGSSGASSEAPLASCDPSKGGASPRIQNSSAERRPGALHNKVHQCLQQGLKSWTRVDNNAKTFQTTSNSGPKWDQVMYRTSYDKN